MLFAACSILKHSVPAQALGASQASMDLDAAELGGEAVAALSTTVKAWAGRCALLPAAFPDSKPAQN